MPPDTTAKQKDERNPLPRFLPPLYVSIVTLSNRANTKLAVAISQEATSCPRNRANLRPAKPKPRRPSRMRSSVHLPQPSTGRNNPPHTPSTAAAGRRERSAGPSPAPSPPSPSYGKDAGGAHPTGSASMPGEQGQRAPAPGAPRGQG